MGPRDDAQLAQARPPRGDRNLRTQAAAEALAANDLAELGRLMAEAAPELQQDFEGSCAEADAMVELARQLPD